jgi:protein-L-isoaspartate(D-aspartate) O-methyltransferase
VDFSKQRKQVVENLKKLGYIKSESVKKVMLKIKREDFVPKEYLDSAYADTPLPIPGGVTISAPHMHAIFLEALDLKLGQKVLEIGAGSGILLAYIKEIVGEEGKVYGIEILPIAYEFAMENLKKTGYDKKVKLILGDGSLGLPKFAPFDKILSSASSPQELPIPWIEQLKPDGSIITPVGPEFGNQTLNLIKKTKSGRIVRKSLYDVIFVTLKGKYGWKF